MQVHEASAALFDVKSAPQPRRALYDTSRVNLLGLASLGTVGALSARSAFCQEAPQQEQTRIANKDGSGDS